VRTVLALSCGLTRTAYWNLAPEIAGYHDPYQMMHLLFGKLPLLDYDGDKLAIRHPAADAFAMLAGRLAGVTQVTRVAPIAGPPTVHAFRVERDGRGPLLIAWDQRDWFDGEDAPPITATLPWHPVPAEVSLSADPVFIEG
jgi:hypothetical protein